MEKMAVLIWLPAIIVAFAFAVVDARTGRGFALAIFSTLHLACTIVVVGGITILAQTPPPPRTLGVTIWLVFYFVPSAYAILIAVIGAAIVAGVARRWLWIVGFVLAAMIPFLVAAAPYSFWDPHTEYVVRQVGFLGVLILPETVVLAYSITRIRRPVMPAPARQQA
jgi:hypothetical protein